MPPSVAENCNKNCNAVPGTVLLLALAVAPAWGFTPEERAAIARHKSLLEAVPDPCRIAERLGERYKDILRAATTGQEVGDVLTAVVGKDGVPLKLGDGIRLSESFAMFDPETRTVYLSSPAVFQRLEPDAGGCPGDEQLSGFARETAGVYVHEACHAIEHEALGPDLVTTSEGELLAYAREARFLDGLEDWPSRPVALEGERRRLVDGQVAMNQRVLGWVKAMQGHSPKSEDFDNLKKYVGLLEDIHAQLRRLEAMRLSVDPLQASLAQMVSCWRDGFDEFLEFSLPNIQTRPSLAKRGENLERSRRYLADSRAVLKKEKPGALAYKLAERAVALAEQDVRFWSDAKRVAEARAFFERRLGAVRPPKRKPETGRGKN